MNLFGSAVSRRLVSFAAVFGDVTQRSPSFLGSVDYHLASAMDSQSRTKGTCILFVEFWSNFIYLFQLVVAMIYKGWIEFLIADIELELMYSFVPVWSCVILFPRLDRRET